MDQLVHFFHGDKVKGNGEFDSMKEQAQFFSTPSSFDGLVGHCWERFGWPLNLKGHFDCGKERPHYVLMPLSFLDDWSNYKEAVRSSTVTCLEVVVDTRSTPLVVHVDDNVDWSP